MRCVHTVCGVIAISLLGACATVTATAAPVPLSTHTAKWIDLQVGDCVADLPPAAAYQFNCRRKVFFAFYFLHNKRI